MEQLLERFLRYVRIDTRAADGVSAVPSSPGQRVLAELLASEMRALGLNAVKVDEHAYVTGYLPASSGCTGPGIGFLAHLDTACESSGTVTPRVLRQYDGGKICLDAEHCLSPEMFPSLKEQIGKTLIVADGSSLLGSDDKSGIAVIMTMLARLQARPDILHGPVHIAFVPDEETGHGAALLDLKTFGAEFAYTLDGSGLGTLECENFHAARADMVITGLGIHPGYAKDRMLNAILIGQAILNMLPQDEIPARTCHREGFFHVLQFHGDVEHARLSILIRDHDMEQFEMRKKRIRHAVADCNRHFVLPGGSLAVQLTLCDQYHNMKEYIDRAPHIVETALQAMRDCHIAPVMQPVRGGTDGARLSARGLPCPNIFCGTHNAHGPYEYVALEDMDQAVRVIMRLVELYAFGIPSVAQSHASVRMRDVIFAGNRLFFSNTDSCFQDAD